MDKRIEGIIADRADWLVDAVATATQNRMFLRGDPECDPVAVEAMEMNGAKAIRIALERSAPKTAAELLAIVATWLEADDPTHWGVMENELYTIVCRNRS
jgi:hypothetical protein